MKIRWLLGSIGALAVLGALAAACGGGGSDDGAAGAAITTHKGLAVAAIGANSSNGSSDSAQVTGGGGLASNGTSSYAQVPAAAPAGEGLSAGAGARSGGGLVSGGFAPAPQLQGGGNGITVQGYGSASAAADSAVADFYFGTNPGIIKPVPAPGVDGAPVSPPITPGTVKPITEADLQPVIDALTAAGVARGDIKFIGQPYGNPSYSAATLEATIKQISAIDAAVQAAQKAAGGLKEITLQNTNVSYTVADCSALEKAAMKAAAEDAAGRATAFADTLALHLGSITGASDYSYSPSGGGCQPVGGPYPFPTMGAMGYAQGQPGEVQVFASISVTYAIQ